MNEGMVNKLPWFFEMEICIQLVNKLIRKCRNLQYVWMSFESDIDLLEKCNLISIFFSQLIPLILFF